MNIGYIKQEEVPLRIIDRIKYFFNMVTILHFEQGKVFKVPICNKIKKMNRSIKNLLKQIQKYKIDTLVFSDKLISDYPAFYQKVEKRLCQNAILDGRKLMRYMDFDIFEYILNLQKTSMKQEDIFFLIKKDLEVDLQFLSRFVENCKTVNIVTNDLDRFKKIQENLYEKENILISVSNNKNKSLKRAKYIFNVNMDKKDIEKFKINRNAIIVNFKENIKYDCNTFNGININYFQINIPDEYIEQFENMNISDFDTVKLYESILLQKIEIEKKKNIMLSKSELAKRKNIAVDIIKRDEIKVTGLIGNNGRINEKEIIQKYEMKV